MTLAVGPTLFLAFLRPRRRPRRGAILLAHGGLGLIGLATAGAFWTQAPASSGAALWDVSPIELGQVAASPFGVKLLVRLALLAIAAGLITPVLRGTATRTRGIVLLAVALTGLTTWPLTGHPSVAPLAPGIVAADVLHIGAMSVWLGGLATLTIFLLRGTRPRVLGVILPAWSRWAALSVVWQFNIYAGRARRQQHHSRVPLHPGRSAPDGAAVDRHLAAAGQRRSATGQPADAAPAATEPGRRRDHLPVPRNLRGRITVRTTAIDEATVTTRITAPANPGTR